MLFYGVYALAQTSISGTIIDASTNNHISNIYIENISTRLLTTSNNQGKFVIPASVGDTLLLSSIGYYWKKYIVLDTEPQTFIMEEQVYELIHILKFADIDYESFKHKIIHQQYEVPKNPYNLQYEPYVPMREYTPGHIAQASIEGPITALYSAFNKHARNELKAKELLANLHYELIIQKKISKEMVKEITEIPQEYFIEFIAFCNFTDEFLVAATDYQLITYIQECSLRFYEKYPHIKL